MRTGHPAAAQQPALRANAMAAGYGRARHPHFATARANRLACGRKITHRAVAAIKGRSQCGGFEIPIIIAASSFRNFKSKDRTRIIKLLGRVLINAGNGRMSALGANRTRRNGRNDVNDPKQTSAGSKLRSAAVSCHGIMCYPFGRLHRRRRRDHLSVITTA